MPFTKRETQRGEHWAWAMKVALGVILVGIFAFACGCGEGAANISLHDAQAFLEDGNAKGRVLVRVNGAPLSAGTRWSLGSEVTFEFDGEMDFSKADDD